MYTFLNHLKKQNSYDCNKNIDEQLVEKDCSITSDDEKGFYPSSEECDTESLAVNKNDDINTLIGSLSDLTISASVNSDISNPTVLNNILPKVRSMVQYHNPYHNSWNKALIISRAGKAKGKNNSLFNVKDKTQDEHTSIDFSKIKRWKNIEE